MDWSTVGQIVVLLLAALFAAMVVKAIVGMDLSKSNARPTLSSDEILALSLAVFSVREQGHHDAADAIDRLLQRLLDRETTDG